MCSLAQAHMTKPGLWTSAAKPPARAAEEWSLIKVISGPTRLSQSRFPQPKPCPPNSSYPAATDSGEPAPSSVFLCYPTHVLKGQRHIFSAV